MDNTGDGGGYVCQGPGEVQATTPGKGFHPMAKVRGTEGTEVLLHGHERAVKRNQGQEGLKVV